MRLLSHTSSSQKGFTLIELLLYTAIVGSLLIAIVAFYGLASGARVKNQSISEVNQQGIAAMDMIMRTIRGANSVTTPATGASGASLALTVPTASLSPTTFSVSNSVLQISEGAGAAVALTNSKVQVTGMTVKNITRGSNAHVQVSLTLSRTNPNARDEFSYQKTFTSSAELQW